MESDNFEEKVKGWLSKGAKASKKAIETVGGKVQDFTDKSVVKIEKKQLESRLESKYTELGKVISDTMIETGNEESSSGSGDCKCLNVGSEEKLNIIKSLQNEIQTLTLQISEKEKEIK